MILFWSIGFALAAAVLLLVLRPLRARRGAPTVSRRTANITVYRDQLRELDADLAAGKLAAPDHERARTELQARLLEDVDAAAEPAPRRGGKAAAVLVGVALPLCALAVYFAVGNPGAFEPRADAVSAHQIEALVERLAAKMRDNPEDAEGWKMLGRSYAALGRYADAVEAYAKAVARAPRDARLLADFADALGMARGRSLQGEPEQLILRALEIDPGNLKALALAGTAAYDRKDYRAAAGYWQRMLPLVPPDSADARAIRGNVAEADRLAGTGVAAGHPGIRGTVRVSPKLKGKFGPDDTVFVYARAAGGPAMPLAVLRRRARELPLDYALDDAMAMAPGMALSAHPRVVISARVSRSGTAQAQAGDLLGASQAVANDAQGVVVVIDGVVP